MENTDYIYKNAFVFNETGELHADLYCAIKDEIGYMVDAKYKVYMDKLCMTTDVEASEFYSTYVDILHKVDVIMMNSKITDLNDYVQSYQSTAKLLKENISMATKTIMTTLKLFDSDIQSLVIAIMTKVNLNEIKTDRGVYSVLSQYFSTDEYRTYKGMQDFLDQCYGTLYDATQINYGGKVYGKKY